MTMVRLTVETENEEWEVVLTSQKYAAMSEVEATSLLIKRVGQIADALLDEAEVAQAVRELHSRDADWTEQHDEMAEVTPPDGYLG